MSTPTPRRPRATKLTPQTPESELPPEHRSPQSFPVSQVAVEADEDWLYEKTQTPADTFSRNRPNWILRIGLSAAGLLISLALSLAVDQLVRDLFDRADWLGYLGLVLSGLVLIALVVFAVSEALALRRFANLDDVRRDAAGVLRGDKSEAGEQIVDRLQQLYARRTDLTAAREKLDGALADRFDGRELIEATEQILMSPLDRRAKALISASARRTTLVTAVSPRALVDIAFVAYESIRLSRDIARLYGTRPGFMSSWKLAGAVLSHLAITGGVAMGDSLIQQLVGHGLAAKLSARLGEGVVNGLMTVRVGIAAMLVTRPLPFDRVKQPKVLDFATEIAKLTETNPAP